METFSSNYISNRVFLQLGKDRLLYFIAIFSKVFNLAKYNYKIYNKELLAIIKYFIKLKFKLEITNMLIKVITNYKILEYFMTKMKLIRGQTCLANFFSKFKFIIFYILSKKMKKQIYYLIVLIIFK